jgi:type IV pilus assembly protein PilM
MSKILLGLDIGTQTTKAIQISRDKDNSTLLAAGYIATPTKAFNSNTTTDEQIMSDTINRLVHDMKVTTTEVSASLPSSKVITRVIEVPIMSDDELASSVEWEAEQYIPLPISKVKIDYAVITKNQEINKMKVLLVAAPIVTIEKYMRIINLAGLNPVALETEILAVARSVNQSFPTLDNLILLTIGATTTEIALLYDHNMVYAKSMPVGGNTFTRAIAQELGFELPQAEEYKKTYGLEEDKLEGKIAKILTPYTNSIFSEIEKTISYFKEQFPKADMNTIVVGGGGAKMPGLVLTLTKTIGLDTQFSNPFVNISVDPNILPSLTPDAPLYTISVGLALKDIS